MDISFDASDTALVEAFVALGRTRHANDPHHLGSAASALLGPAAGTGQRYFAVTRANGDLKARVVADAKTGFLGHYEAATDASSDEVKRLLHNACHHLSEAGWGTAIGPINGSTWSSYRFTVPNGTRPFFLDNHHPEEYLVQWRAAGFEPVERYLSTLIECARTSPTLCPRFAKRLAQRGITIEAVTPERFDQELRAIHALSNTAFARSPFFSPISYEAFEVLYQPVTAVVDPNWTLMARGPSGELLAFIFATPDYFDPERRSLVIKTVASRAPGLGSWLTGLLHRRAHDAGYARIFHALMHESNKSTQIHAAEAKVYRRYLLLGKPL